MVGEESSLPFSSPPLWKVLLIAIFKCLHFSLGITLTSGILHFSNMGVNSKIVLTETRQSAFFLTFVCWHTAKDIYIIYWRYVSKIFYYAHVFSRIRHRHYCDCEAEAELKWNPFKAKIKNRLWTAPKWPDLSTLETQRRNGFPYSVGTWQPSNYLKLETF